MTRFQLGRVASSDCVGIDLEDSVLLLAHQRPERYPYERPLRLFQFYTWVLTSESRQYWVWAGIVAAVKLLEHIEHNIHCEDTELIREQLGQARGLINLNDKPPWTLKRQCILNENASYRGLHDETIAKVGGLAALLSVPSLPEFTKHLERRQSEAEIIYELVDYQVRYAQHTPSTDDRIDIRYAIHFKWSPTKDIQGIRGKTVEGKSPSYKTLKKRWNAFRRTALFTYLYGRQEFTEPEIKLDNDLFAEGLIRQSENKDAMQSFFGAYAYLSELLRSSGEDCLIIPVPDSIERVPIPTLSFSSKEIAIMKAYDNEYLEMMQP